VWEAKEGDLRREKDQKVMRRFQGMNEYDEALDYNWYSFQEDTSLRSSAVLLTLRTCSSISNYNHHRVVCCSYTRSSRSNSSRISTSSSRVCILR
jgi:hypothetical protein